MQKGGGSTCATSAHITPACMAPCKLEQWARLLQWCGPFFLSVGEQQAATWALPQKEKAHTTFRQLCPPL